MADTTERDPLDVSPQPIPLPQTGALTPADEEIDSLAAPPDMGPIIARHQIEAGQVNHGDARDWAENAVAGVQAALAGFGAAGRVPAGGGALTGIGAAARASQENQQRQKQQAFANKMAQQKQMTEEQVSQAQIAHLNAEQHNIERLSRDADEEHMQKMLAFDQTAAEPYIDAGTQSLGENLTSDDLKRMLHQGLNGKSEINGHEVLVFRDGLAPNMGPDGKPALGPNGEPVNRPTYRLFAADGPGVKFTDEQAKLISDNTAYKPKPGVEVDPVSAYTILTQAKKNQAVNLNIEKVQAEIGKSKAEEGKAQEETTDKQEQRQLEQKAAKIFSPYLAQANGDPWRAIQLMGKDPSARGQIGVIEQAYGPGHIEEWHQKQEEIGLRAQELAQKKLENEKVWGDPNAATPAAFRASLTPAQQSSVDMVGQGRAPINSPSYLLARNPAFIEAVGRLYPDVDLSKIDAYKDAYKKFTSGKQGDAVNSGATALEHLEELKALNTPESMIPGTPAHTRYQNKVGTVTSELMDFYRMAKTEVSEKDIKNTLDSASTWNRAAAIQTQAKSMGDKLENYKEQWDSAAPSSAYQAQYPGISDTFKARQARARLDPDYAKAHPEALIPKGSVRVQIPGQPPGYVPQANLDAFRKAHPNAQVIQ